MAASKGFMYHLSMAACEWFLMFLMLLDAALAYLLTKFAHHCELQSPCMFCLRLDHFFGNEKRGSYLSLFCHQHRAEVSSLISCDLHDKLADAREMCDDCFMSIMNCKIGAKGYQKSYLNKNFVRSPSSSGLCSCCETYWKPKPIGRRLQSGSVRLGPVRVTMKPPLPRVTGRGRFRRRNHFKRVRDKISGNSTPCHVENNISGNMDMDTLSDSGCVRFNSDSECEIPVSKHVLIMSEDSFYSDSDSEFDIPVSKNVPKAVVVHRKRGSKDQTQAIHGTSGQKQDRTRAKRSHGVSDRETSILDGHHSESTPIPASLASKDPIGHGPKEFNHAELHSRDVSVPSVPQERSSTSKGSIQDSIGHVELHSRDVSAPSVQERSSTSKGSIQDSIGHVELHSRDVSAPSVPQERSLISRVSNEDATGHLELHFRDDSGPSVPQDSGSTLDQRKLSADDVLNGNSLPEVSKNERSSPSRGSNQDLPSSTDIKRDLSKSDGVNNDHKASSSSDKSDGYESPAASVSDIEGESVVDKLKRQVEHDRERLHLLHMELEEERSAAAVAADEAMAMITRLQEEKAALHMEALQYLRMMDEQAEYDMEALDKANDLVAEKDKEIQDLEAELEYFRSRYDEELFMGNPMVETENFQKNHLGNGKTDAKISTFDSKSRKAPVLDLQDEKRYILQCLSELETKFNQVSSDQHTSIGKSNGNIHTEIENLEDLQADNGTQSKHKDSSTSNGSKKVDVGTLENEIADLNERLEALEADRDFLEHACNTLQANGGIEFIQEIAHHLQDLRRIRFDRRCQLVA